MDHPLLTDDVNNARGQTIDLFKCLGYFRLPFYLRGQNVNLLTHIETEITCWKIAK